MGSTSHAAIRLARRGKDKETESFPYLRVFTTSTGRELALYFQYQDEIAIEQILWLPDNRRLIAADIQGNFTLLDAPNAKVLWREKPFERFLRAATSPDGRILLVLGHERYRADERGPSVLKMWNLQGDQPRAVNRNLMPIAPTAILADNNRILSGNAIWNLETGAKETQFKHPEEFPVAVSPDGRFILCHNHLKSLQRWIDEERFELWDVAGGTWIAPSKKVWKWPVTSRGIRWDEAEKKHFQYVVYWDVETGKPIRSVKGEGYLMSADGGKIFGWTGPNSSGVQGLEENRELVNIWEYPLSAGGWR